MEGKDRRHGEMTYHGPRTDAAGVTGGTVKGSKVAGIYIENLHVYDQPSGLPKIMKCKGIQQDRRCTYGSETYFATCPECHLTDIKCPGKTEPCGSCHYTYDKFCISCGREVPARCQQMKKDGTLCNTRLREDAKFCPECGLEVWEKVPDEKPKPGRSEDCSQNTEEESEVKKNKPNREIVIMPGITETEVTNAATTKWTLKIITNALEILKIAMNPPEPLQNLFTSCSKKFNALCRTLSDGCLEFCFLHENTSAAQDMIDRREEVLAIFQQFFCDLGTDIILQESDVKVLLFPAIASTNVIRQGDARADKDEETTSDYPDDEQLQHSVNVLEKATANTEKMILLLSSGDRKSKMIYLSRETETLRLFDIYFEGLLPAYHLPTDMALDVKPSSADEHDRDQRLETEDYMRHVLHQFKRGIDGRRDLFPLLGDMMKQVKGILPYLQTKIDYLQLATSGNLQSEDREKPTGVSVDEGLPSLDHEKRVKQSDKEDETVSTNSPEPDLEKNSKVQGGKPGVFQSSGKPEKPEKRKKKLDTLKTVIKTVFTKPKRGKPGVTQRRGDDINEVTDSEKPEKPKGKLETLKTVIKTVFTKTKPTSGNLQSEDREKPNGVSVDEGLPSLDYEKRVTQTDKKDETVSTNSPDPESEETSEVQGGKPEVTQSRGDAMNEVTDSEKTEELKKKLETLKTEADRKQQDLREVREGNDYGVEWEYIMDCLSQNMAQLRIQDVITDVIGEDQLPAISDKQMKPNGCLDGGSRTRGREMRPCLIYPLRQLQFGTLRQRDLMDIVRDVIKVDQERLTNLRTQSDRLEHVYGSPIHIVGEIDTEHSGPVSCPPMTFNRERVNRRLTVSGDGLELISSDSGDHHDGQFRKYLGTCSRLPIPLPLSPSTLTVPIYWETHSRVQVEGVYRPLLEMGVCGEGEVDTKSLVSCQTRSSWSVFVIYCNEHDGYCTQVWENGRRVGGCHDTVSPTPGTDLIYKWGIALDMGRRRLAFLDVKRGRVLHRLDIKVDEPLVPMFGMLPLSVDRINMRLVSGSQLPITDTHKHLIAKALYSP